MPEFLAPGVFIEELPAQPHPIPGVPVLSMAGFSPQVGQSRAHALGLSGINHLPFVAWRRSQSSRAADQDSEGKYVNIRRLAVFIEHSIFHSLQWAVFEPNGPLLWAALSSSIEGFLSGLWQSGALHGKKRAEAFFVRCDRTTMTQNDIDDGRFVILVGFAPIHPAEFILLRITGQTRKP